MFESGPNFATAMEIFVARVIMVTFVPYWLQCRALSMTVFYTIFLYSVMHFCYDWSLLRECVNADPRKFCKLIPRYEVKFQKSLDCGGAYVKLLSSRDDLDLVSELLHSYCIAQFCFEDVIPSLFPRLFWVWPKQTSGQFEKKKNGDIVSHFCVECCQFWSTVQTNNDSIRLDQGFS